MFQQGQVTYIQADFLPKIMVHEILECVIFCLMSDMSRRRFQLQSRKKSSSRPTYPTVIFSNERYVKIQVFKHGVSKKSSMCCFCLMSDCFKKEMFKQEIFKYRYVVYWEIWLCQDTQVFKQEIFIVQIELCFVVLPKQMKCSERLKKPR